MEIDVANAMVEASPPRSKPDGDTHGYEPESFRVGKTSGALNRQQSNIVAWIKGLGVPIERDQSTSQQASGSRHRQTARISTNTLAIAIRFVLVCAAVPECDGGSLCVAQGWRVFVRVGSRRGKQVWVPHPHLRLRSRCSYAVFCPVACPTC